MVVLRVSGMNRTGSHFVVAHLVVLVGEVYPQHAHTLKNNLHGGQKVVQNGWLESKKHRPVIDYQHQFQCTEGSVNLRHTQAVMGLTQN